MKKIARKKVVRQAAIEAQQRWLPLMGMMLTLRRGLRELVLEGRRVSVARPRARTVDESEVVLPSWKQFGDEDPLSQRVVEQMLMGVATRKYKRSLEPLPFEVKERGTSQERSEPALHRGDHAESRRVDETRPRQITNCWTHD